MQEIIIQIGFFFELIYLHLRPEEKEFKHNTDVKVRNYSTVKRRVQKQNIHKS